MKQVICYCGSGDVCKCTAALCINEKKSNQHKSFAYACEATCTTTTASSAVPLFFMQTS